MSNEAHSDGEQVLGKQAVWAPVSPAATATIFTVGCPLAAFLVPLKLSLAYIVLSPLIVLSLLSWRINPHAYRLPIQERRVLVPLIFFLLMCTLSVIVGVAPLNGISSLLSLVFFAGTVNVFLWHAPLLQTASAILAGQSIAAIHSCLDASFPGAIPPLFQGPVTESGQLAVSVVMAIGLMWHFATQLNNKTYARRRLLMGLVLTTLLVTMSFHNQTMLAPSILIVCSWLAALAFFYSLRLSLRASNAAQRVSLLASIQLPLLVCALLVNLKRGPWLGVLAGSFVFFAFYARRALTTLVGISLLAIVCIAPVRDRIAASYDHFTISGGRSTMWRIALDLASEYPLGIGYHNSGIIRELSPEIPPELKHFHNNILNVLTETGWIGAVVFLWFIFALCRYCFSDRRNILVIAMGCTLISWQIAGLVEYNIGDSEVLIPVWMLIGSLLYSVRSDRVSSMAEPG